MPDAGGNIRGIAVPAEAWERIFGKRECGQEPKTCKWGDACADCQLDECTIDTQSNRKLYLQ